MRYQVLLFGACVFLAGMGEGAEKESAIIDRVYAEVDGRKLHVEVRLPQMPQMSQLPEGAAAANQKPPLVVWIHGGGWRGGSYKEQKIRWVLEHGYALASIQYRFTNVAIFPAQIYDCKGAIRWLRAHADELGYDASRIVVGGSSAGAHLALLLGTSGDVKSLEGAVGGNGHVSSRVQGVLNYFGPSDFVLRDKTQRELANTPKVGSFALLGGTKDKGVDMQLAYQASPSSYVTKDDPPLMTLQGLQDFRVLLDQAQRMTDLYEAAGLDVEMHLHEKAKHGDKRLFDGVYQEAALRFLKKVMRAE